ncbi:hypothetical protein D3C71_2028460 [compost metagenome]
MRLGDTAFELGQLRCRKAHRIGHRLAMDEGFAMRRLEQFLAVGGGHFDEITEDAIVLDF